MFHALPGGPDLLLGEQQPPERHGIRLLLHRGGGRPTALQPERDPDALEQHPLQLRLPPRGHPVLHPPARRRLRRQQQQCRPCPHHHGQPSGSPGPSANLTARPTRAPGQLGGDWQLRPPANPESTCANEVAFPRGLRAPERSTSPTAAPSASSSTCGAGPATPWLCASSPTASATAATGAPGRRPSPC
ncbi:erythropoietin receptor [Chelydra serpentina]|uniref:Erythropoietin receptor n=1 Tax=Chelydra serpentina TaxID=8475 RepID=A0A8T1RX84_CHESE|nr:erythropoietin receptor [Chelydra serpentina]